jgi:hypothetical protein
MLSDLKDASINIYSSGAKYGRNRITGEYVRIDENPNMYLELLKACIRNEQYDYIFFDRLVLVYELLKNLIFQLENNSINKYQFTSIMTIMTTTSGLLSSLFNYRHFNIITNDKGEEVYENPLKNFIIKDNKWDFSGINNLDQLNNSSSVLLYLLMKSDNNGIDVTLKKIVEYWPTLLKIIVDNNKIQDGVDFLKGWVFMISKLNNCINILNFTNDTLVSNGNIQKFTSKSIKNTDPDFKDQKNIIITNIIDNLLLLDKNMEAQINQSYSIDEFIRTTKPCPMTLKASYIASVSNNFIMFGSENKDGIIGIYPFKEFKKIKNTDITREQNPQQTHSIKKYLHEICFKTLDESKDGSGNFVWR